jgi:probable addiction module antidote protein
MAKTKRFHPADYLDSADAIAAYLSEAFETGDAEFVTQAIGNIARARGMGGIARDTELNRQNLYKSLSAEGRPEFATVMKVLDALGIQLKAEAKSA